MAYPSMKKAAQVAAASMAATPQIAPIGNRGGRPFFRGNEYVHTGPVENPVEILAAKRDQAMARVNEAAGLLGRARVLFQLASRAPFYKSFSARPTPEELKEIAHADAAVAEYSAVLDAANRALEIATTKLNLRLMGIQANAGVESE
jgi:hypothetical protein